MQSGRKSPSASTSVSVSPAQVIDGSSGAKRRSSWNQSREEYGFEDPFAMTPPALPLESAAQPPGFQPRPRYPSQASVDSSVSMATTEGDEVHLTSAAVGGGGDLRWKDDPEHRIGDPPPPRRLARPAGHYGETNTPRRTLGTLKSVSRNIRRASMRVVNLAGVTLEDRPYRLDDDDDQPGDQPMGRPLPGQEEALPELVRDRLRGRTLGLFGPKSVVRRAMLSFLLWSWTEPAILLLILVNAVVLTIQAHRSVFLEPREDGFFKSWEDYVLFVLFIIFSLEAFARILVTGLILDPETRVTDFRSIGRSIMATQSRVHAQFNASTATVNTAAMQQEMSMDDKHCYPPTNHSGPYGSHTMDRSTSTWAGSKIGLVHHPFQVAIEKQQSLSEQNQPYLRHSWNRIDFVAVVSFWIMFGLAITGAETELNRHLYIFRAMSVLRVSRLLAVTTGTTTIMRSLKIAGPLLVKVAVFVLFAMVLFSIIGVQSFKGSFRRTCQLVSSPGGDLTDLRQSCGGYIDPVTLNTTGYLDRNNQTYPDPKGFTCPLGQICLEAGSNPHNDIQSFDNIFFGALQVLIIAGANQWAPTMYMMMDADYYVASIFFVVCIIILNFWLINLFVAVITNTFSTIRAETKKSAFGAGTSGPMIDEKAEEWSMIVGQRHGTRSRLQDWYMRTQLGWVTLIFADLVTQGTRTSTSSPAHLQLLDNFELVATVAFDIEMVWRTCAYLPDWRAFAEKRANFIDLFLALITTIIQIPVIHRSRWYPWLTIFQLLRFYRVILAVPRMRPLLLRVFGNMNGLINMTLFLMITNLLGGLIAAQLFRGDVAADSGNMNFAETYAAFLAMYQVFSSENWTDILYLTADSEAPYQQAVIAVLFFVAWFIFANFILLQMFIAVINENFEVAEEQKRARQFDAYLRKTEPRSTRVNWLDKWNPYRFVKSNPKSVAVESMPSGLVLPLKKAIVQDGRGRRQASGSVSQFPQESEKQTGVAGTLRRLFDLDHAAESVPMTSLNRIRRESVAANRTPQEIEAEQHLDFLPSTLPDPSAEEAHDEISEEHAKKVDFIEAHPSYDKTFWVFANQNPIRAACQMLVTPANGERIFGTPPSRIAEPFFQLVIILAVIGGIIVAAIATPMYRRTYYAEHGFVRDTWFDIADTVFGGILVVEFLIKVTADGFAWTPNAYLLSIWNVIDFIILGAILVNMITTIVVVGGVSRLTRSLKAFRALRLITFFPWMRETFHSVLFAGAQSLMEAALLAFLYIVPYAIWGLNLFAGLMFTCNDSNSSGKSDCINEYINNPIDGSDLGFLAPRAWDKPAPSTVFSFDNFGSSLLILFEVVSFEGWIDVMGTAMDLTDRDKQPSLNNSQVNSLFFLTYDLLGAVIIFTLFVSIIIGNFSSRSGMALLTEEQKRWIDLQKLIKRQRPSKRPKTKPKSPWRAWCFDRAVQKNGWWSRGLTVLYVIHIIALMTQTFTNGNTVDRIRDFLFLALTSIYFVDIMVRITGLGLRSFRANGWNLFDVFVVSGSFATTVPIVMGSQGFTIQQLQKLFLVCIAFKLVQKQNGLNQLFKTSISSLPAILKLLLLWITLFIFFAIVSVEVFGLTRWESAETHTQNYREFSNALIMLIFMSVGEGWNQYMHDFTVSYPRCTNSNASDPDSDCGSTAWAYFLFIAWNLLSMYIFVNMFTGVVVENFSFVFQLNNSQGSITRQEMRAFKKVWSVFDVDGTGYLNRGSIVPFLSRLTGLFEVRIYPAEFSVRRLAKECQAPANVPRTAYSAPVVGGIDLGRLGETLETINHKEIARRRTLYNRLYHEAMITAEPGKGISFTNMLLLLAHYKIIDDDNALRLDEMIYRRATTEHVTDLVNYDRVKSLLKMIACRRRYVAQREERFALERAEMQGDIPAIVVDDMPRTPQHRSWDITMAGRDSMGFRLEDESPTPSPIRPVWSPDHTPQPSQPSSPAQEYRPRRSDVSGLSGDFSGYVDPRRESVGLGDRSPQQVLSTLDSSVWGEMMHEAAEDE